MIQFFQMIQFAPNASVRNSSSLRRGTRGVDWIIVGGESGDEARVCHVEWIRHLVEQAQEQGVACFVKQLGSKPYLNGRPFPLRVKPGGNKGGDPEEWPADLRVREWPTWPTLGQPLSVGRPG
jgi:hypothetical protein